MLTHHILTTLGLAATVSAIDLRFFSNNQCTRSYVYCQNANPKFCCWTTEETYTLSAGLFAIPKEWSIVCEFWVQSGCSAGPLRGTTLNNGRDYVCAGGAVAGQKNYVRGLSYYFNGKKRDEVHEVQAEAVVGQPTEGCVRADRLHLEDGREFDLSGLSNETYSDVLKMSTDVTKQAQIAEILKR